MCNAMRYDENRPGNHGTLRKSIQHGLPILWAPGESSILYGRSLLRPCSIACERQDHMPEALSSDAHGFCPIESTFITRNPVHLIVTHAKRDLAIMADTVGPTIYNDIHLTLNLVARVKVNCAIL